MGLYSAEAAPAVVEVEVRLVGVDLADLPQQQHYCCCCCWRAEVVIAELPRAWWQRVSEGLRRQFDVLVAVQRELLW